MLKGAILLKNTAPKVLEMRSYNGQVVGNDLRKLLGDVIIHLPVLVPWFLSSIEVESGTFEKNTKKKKLAPKVDCGT